MRSATEKQLAKRKAEGETFIRSTIRPSKPKQKESGSGYCPIRRKTKVKKVNKKRRVSEFARCYHSRARVAWVKSQPCIVCVAIWPAIGLVSPHSDNAHSEGSGMGHKAGYETIVPLCREHHRRYDEHRFPLDDEKVRARIVRAAKEVEKLWQAHSQRGE